MNNLEKLTDKELYGICKKWGSEALSARRKFAGLLPEVYRRELASRGAGGGSWLKKRGFTCIYEFAAKLAGMSRDQVDLVVRIEKRLEDKPVLREALVNGEISVNKLARIVSIATVENQEEILKKVENLSKVALEVFVKDVKRDGGTRDGEARGDGKSGGEMSEDGIHESEKSDGLPMRKNEQIAVPGHGLKLDEDIENELLQMQEIGLDVNGMLRKFLRDRKEKLAARKRVASEKQKKEREDRALIGYPAKRYVPAEIKKIIQEEFGDRCSVEGYRKPAKNLHHEKGFAITQTHNPNTLKPLCKGHHELAHAESGSSPTFSRSKRKYSYYNMSPPDIHTSADTLEHILRQDTASAAQQD